MSHPRAKQHASTSTLSFSETDTQPTPVTGGSRGKNLVKTSLKYLIPALKVTKEMSSVCPQLQLALGVLIKILETYKGYSEATEAIGTLLSRIHSLNKKLGKIQSEDSCPPTLKERLDLFTSQLQEVVEDANKVQSERRIARFFNATKNVKKTESWIQKLNQHISDFSIEGIFTLELTVHQGFIAITTTMGTSAWAQANDALHSALRPVVEALLHSGSSVHVQCHENTREEVLATLCAWLQPEGPRPQQPGTAPLDRSICWLYALAGTGKSTIALTIAERWEREKLLGASFFCARDGERSSVNCIFRTIAYQLALRFPAFREHLTKVLKTDPDLYSSTPTRQLEKLIVEPLEAVRADAKSEAPFPSHVAIVIDALDECTDTAAVSAVLKSLALYIARLAPLRFLVTSRPEENIARGFLLQNIREDTQDLALNQTPKDVTRRDISAFLQSRLDEIQ
ncbi:hypothetical protein ONZ51_g10975 [Trametes cubensis]|uniref:Nephrocystin 3-like N-terminal domain-containing protein n=1 Tax=Trametes cubensis TaxID=1111947 RepID=A0AAD7X8C0_9APHY|nr:hypothetical protein ONZ51_g10975 [Trametes cubensis]